MRRGESPWLCRNDRQSSLRNQRTAPSGHRCQELYKHSHRLAALTKSGIHFPVRWKRHFKDSKAWSFNPLFTDCDVWGKSPWVPASFSIWKSIPSTSWGYCRESESTSKWSKSVTCYLHVTIYRVTHRQSGPRTAPFRSPWFPSPHPISFLPWCFTPPSSNTQTQC